MYIAAYVYTISNIVCIGKICSICTTPPVLNQLWCYSVRESILWTSLVHRSICGGKGLGINCLLMRQISHKLIVY